MKKLIFQLTTAADLRAKLGRDLDRLKNEPMNADAAFNFFVTAEHLLDWVYPKNINKARRTKELYPIAGMLAFG